jgi:hypothetical protein
LSATLLCSSLVSQNLSSDCRSVKGLDLPTCGFAHYASRGLVLEQTTSVSLVANREEWGP